VLSAGRVVGATILGHHPADVAAVQAGLPDGIAVDAAAVESLRLGQWEVLSEKS
jgi:hypothetical protein